MTEQTYDIEFIKEKMKRTDYVHRYIPSGRLSFYDPDNSDVVYNGYDDEPWYTSDGYLFAFKLDDWELYDSMFPTQALEFLEKRISEKREEK